VAVDLPEEACTDSIGRSSSRYTSASSTFTTKCKGNKSDISHTLDKSQKYIYKAKKHPKEYNFFK